MILDIFVPWYTNSDSHERARGKMKYGGKMEHRVFGKKHARSGCIFTSTWYLLLASSASYTEIKLAIDHVLSILQKRNFTLSINQFTPVLTSIALTNQVVKPLHVIRYYHVPFFRIFASFWMSNGRYYSWHDAFSPKVTTGVKWNMLCWGKWHCGAK